MIPEKSIDLIDYENKKIRSLMRPVHVFALVFLCLLLGSCEKEELDLQPLQQEFVYHQDFDPGVLLNDETELDLTGDGSNDIAIKFEYDTNGSGWENFFEHEYTGKIESLKNNVSLSIGTQIDGFEYDCFENGDELNMPWTWQHEIEFSDYSYESNLGIYDVEGLLDVNNHDGYFGVRIINEDAVTFGWIKTTYEATSNQITLEEFAIGNGFNYFQVGRTE